MTVRRKTDKTKENSLFYLMTALLNPFVCFGLLKCSATWLRNLSPRAQHVHGEELCCLLEQSTRTWWSEQQPTGHCHKMWTTLWARSSHRLPAGPSCSTNTRVPNLPCSGVARVSQCLKNIRYMCMGIAGKVLVYLENWQQAAVMAYL